MKRKHLVSQIVPMYLLITVVALVAVSWFSTSVFKKFHIKKISQDILASAMLVREQFAAPVAEDDFSTVDSIAKILGDKTGLRLTVLLSDGRVAGDSREDPANMDNHAGRPEVMAALLGEEGVALRYSRTMKKQMIYGAVPLIRNGKKVAVVRVSVPVTSIDRAFGNVYIKIAIAGFIIMLWVVFAGLRISDKINRPLEEIRKGVRQLAKGDFNTRLPVPDTEEIGALAETMNEMAAELTRLESVRRDFVANVSHELKTPLTSIMGFSETLLEGAVEDKEQAVHFIEIIHKQADRLSAIIEDLLLLSRIEQQNGKSEIFLEKCSVYEILNNAKEVCIYAADKKGSEIQIECDKTLTAVMNAPLLEQAVVNLADNAVKFSAGGSKIILAAFINDNKELQIDVKDQGAGIDRMHLSRLFERFYRVDKARSRKLGGTGLGLAIVRHIAQMHGGKARVRSKPGNGSIFSILIPQTTVYMEPGNGALLNRTYT